MASRFLVYGLVDPRTGHLRYVGKSTSGMRRPRAHCTPANLRKGTHKANWLRQLVADGTRPEITVLQECSGPEELYDLEQGWISYFRGLGAPLTNATDGGPGILGIKRSSETRARISAALMGHPVGEATRKAVSLAHKGKPVSPEMRARMAVVFQGKTHGPEARAKMAAANRGKAVGQSTRLRLSQVNGGRPFVDEKGNQYLMLSQASSALGVTATKVSAVLRGQRKKTGGHTFRYVEVSHG